MPVPIQEGVLGTILRAATRWSEAELRQLLAGLPAYTCDRSGLITYFNPPAAEIWGREPKLQHPDDRYCGSFKLYASDGARIRHEECWMARALKDEASYNGREIVVERPDGSRVTALAHANPIRDASGAVSGAVNVLLDISDRRCVEDSQDRFLATLVRDLRGPLAPIRSAVETLQRRGVAPEQAAEALAVIERGVEQLTRRIEDLTDLSRITRDRLELKPQRVWLSEVIALAVETSRPRIDAEGHELTVAMPEEPIVLIADPARLAQAFSSLLHNAARFTGRGGRIWIRASQEDGKVAVSVRDTGIGLEPGILQSIVEILTQAEGSRSRRVLGIGLILVRRLVEMHGGAVEARSDGPNRGSEFTVRLPVAAERDLLAAQLAGPSPGPAARGGSDSI